MAPPAGCDPTADPKDAPKCVVSDYGVFVDVAGGLDTNSGTPDAPVRTIKAAQGLLNGKPRIVYEFDQADLVSGYLYPAMARTFRAVGAQSATMFAYDMLQTAPFNLGWQTHFLNLVHTPKKAVSACITRPKIP